MKEVPKKNVSTRTTDIFRDDEDRDQSESAPQPSQSPRIDTSRLERIAPRGLPIVPPQRIGRFVALFIFIAILGAGIFMFGVYRRGSAQFQAALQDLKTMHEAVPDIKDLDFEAAQAKLLSGNHEGGGSATDMFSTLLGSFGASYGDLQEVSRTSVRLLTDLSTLEKEWPQLIFKKKDGELIKLLMSLRNNVADLSAASTGIIDTAKTFSAFSPVDPALYLDMQIEMQRAKTFLNSFISYLDADERHIAILLQNSSELRPGGGFLGSYADVTLSRGSVTSIDVRDVNEADRELKENIVPPKPLQALVKRFRAADANWFFDFPASAEKTLSLLDASELYTKQNWHFDGAIAVTPQVISDILAKTGPIVVSPKLTLTKDNFLFEIQKEVQAGQAAQASAPKQILDGLTPLLISELTSSGTSSRAELEDIASWFTRKNLMVYFRDPNLQEFFDVHGFAGSVFQTPKDSNGDYLAVVNANIGGGKSDLFMKQTVSLTSQVGLDGLVSNHLEVERKHEGSDAPGWWYKVTNQNYLQVFAPAQARVTGVLGALNKKVVAPLNYVKAGYATSSDLEAIEKTMTESDIFPGLTTSEQFDKKVFALWTKTPVGEMSKVALDYAHRMFTPPKDGEVYTFVFEKQSGASGTYRLEIAAPVGFRWKENSLPIYEYTTDDLPGRLMLRLTFEKAL